MSDFYAFSEIDTAISRTKELLWPIRSGTWLRLAVIAFFVGAVTGINLPMKFPGSTISDPVTQGEVLQNMPFIVAVIAAVVILAALFCLTGMIFQFVFVDCLKNRHILIRSYFRNRMGKGLRLFIFMGVLAAVCIAAITAIILLMLPAIINTGTVGFANILVLLLIIPVLAIPFLLVFTLTIDFVVPVMIRGDCGVIEGWGVCFRLIKEHFIETAVYVITKAVLWIVTGIIATILITIAVLIIGIPLLILSVALALPEAALILLMIPVLLIIIPITLIISVPFSVFFRHYSLLVLGDMEGRYSLLQ